nr:AEC family transporter [Romboutsia sp. Marseille-P6047]
MVINVILPCNVINSFYVEFSKDILINGITILLVSCLLQFVCTFLSSTLFQKVNKERRTVLQYATVCSNAGFLGNPVAEGIYGSMGLLYASIYLIPQRIVMWSAGLSYFTESSSKKDLIKKVVTHPCIVAVGIGLIIMIFQIKLPIFLSDTIKSISGCTTSISMILIGSILADVDIKDMSSKLMWAFSLLRLIIIPLIVLVGCKITNIQSLITGVAVVLAGMPAGSTTAILASKYGGDAEFASKCVVLTTILSMLAIPMWCIVLSFV